MLQLGSLLRSILLAEERKLIVPLRRGYCPVFLAAG